MIRAELVAGAPALPADRKASRTINRMASIINDPNGRKRIEFNGLAGDRRYAIRLGQATKREAQAFCDHLSHLTSAAIRGASPDDDTSRWLAGLPDKTTSKLVLAGFIQPLTRVRPATAAAFIDAYIADRTDAKPRTIINLKTARKFFVQFFSEGRDLRSITEGDADEFSRYLTRSKELNGAGLGKNTARRVCGYAKQFLGGAGRKRLITSNPFSDVPCRVQSNDTKSFVSRQDADRVIQACPDDEWRLIFTLARYGGLRVPSDLLALRLADVDLARRRMIVRAPKKEHHEGKGLREMPIFPEIMPYLRAAVDRAASEFVIARYRDTSANLRTQLRRIIRRAGLTPWPATFNSLRSSRQTELADEYPMHVACAWIGNSEAVARKHYLQVRDKDFDRASDVKTAHTGAASSESKGNNTTQTPQNPREFPQYSGPLLPVPQILLLSAGVEQAKDIAGEKPDCETRVVNSSQNGDGFAELIERWPAASAGFKATVMALFGAEKARLNASD